MTEPTPSDDKSDPAARKAWVVGYLAKLLGIDSRHVNLEKGLNHYGLDSVDAMIMAGDLEAHFGVELDPAAFLEFDTLQEMLDGWDEISRPT